MEHQYRGKMNIFVSRDEIHAPWYGKFEVFSKLFVK